MSFTDNSLDGSPLMRLPSVVDHQQPLARILYQQVLQKRRELARAQVEAAMVVSPANRWGHDAIDVHPGLVIPRRHRGPHPPGPTRPSTWDNSVPWPRQHNSSPSADQSSNSACSAVIQASCFPLLARRCRWRRRRKRHLSSCGNGRIRSRQSSTLKWVEPTCRTHVVVPKRMGPPASWGQPRTASVTRVRGPAVSHVGRPRMVSRFSPGTPSWLKACTPLRLYPRPDTATAPSRDSSCPQAAAEGSGTAHAAAPRASDVRRAGLQRMLPW
jgi:hypothetical protein